MNAVSPTRAAWYRDELTNYLRTLAVTQRNDYVSAEYRAGYLSALSHVAGLLGLEAPANFVAPAKDGMDSDTPWRTGIADPEDD